MLDAPVPGLHAAAARDPHRRVWLLDGAGPHVDIAQLGVLAVVREGLVGLPRLHDEVDALAVLLPQRGRGLPVGEAGVHRRAHREARYEAATRQHVEHGELLGHARGRVVEGDGVAHHHDLGLVGSTAEGGGHQVGRRHEPIRVLMVLVDTDPVVAALLGELELVEILVVDLVTPLRVVQLVGRRVDPHAAVLVAEVVGQVGPGHQVEPVELHRPSPQQEARSSKMMIRVSL